MISAKYINPACVIVWLMNTIIWVIGPSSWMGWVTAVPLCIYVYLTYVDYRKGVYK